MPAPRPRQKHPLRVPSLCLQCFLIHLMCVMSLHVLPEPASVSRSCGSSECGGLKARGGPQKSYSEQCQAPSSSVPQRPDLWGSKEEFNLGKMGGGDWRGARSKLSWAPAGTQTRLPQTPHFHLSFVLISPFCLKHAVI